MADGAPNVGNLDKRGRCPRANERTSARKSAAEWRAFDAPTSRKRTSGWSNDKRRAGCPKNSWRGEISFTLQRPFFCQTARRLQQSAKALIRPAVKPEAAGPPSGYRVALSLMRRGSDTSASAAQRDEPSADLVRPPQQHAKAFAVWPVVSLF